MKNNIDGFYLKEARRIRQEYLQALSTIKKKQPRINKYKKEIERYRDEIDILYKSDEKNSIKEELYIEKMEELIQNVNKVEDEVQPYYIKIKKLNFDSLKLKNLIIERYPTITMDEIKEQIIPYVADLK
jgi:septal ring factor EnvC (AmiA/AmiB activator)